MFPSQPAPGSTSPARPLLGGHTTRSHQGEALSPVGRQRQAAFRPNQPHRGQTMQAQRTDDPTLCVICPPHEANADVYFSFSFGKVIYRFAYNRGYH
jgi:hypothetical protein